MIKSVKFPSLESLVVEYIDGSVTSKLNGEIIAEFSILENGGDAILYGLVLDDKYRNKGYSLSIFNNMINILYDLYETSSLVVDNTNKSAIRLYLKMGYKIIGFEDYQYKMKLELKKPTI